jgi:membrane protein implicated in regulation of membrane protease activity
MGDSGPWEATLVIVAVLLALAIMLVVAWQIIRHNATRDWQAQAVEAGVGEFVIVEPGTGKSEFRFKSK